MFSEATVYARKTGKSGPILGASHKSPERRCRDFVEKYRGENAEEFSGKCRKRPRKWGKQGEEILPPFARKRAKGAAGGAEGPLPACLFALDLSVYPIVRAWGFTTGSYQVPDEETIQALLPLVDYTKIQYNDATGAVVLPAEMEIDLGSVAKGYAGQLAAQMLRERGVESALLNLGGNVQTVGTKPDGSSWQIGIKDPKGEDAMMVLSVADQAVVTSGGYERYFEQDGQTYWHIMDPFTGHPADSGLISVTIVGDEGVVCDGLSTALFVMGLEKAADLWAQSGDFEAVFVTASGEVYITEGLRDRFALTEQYADTPVSVIGR